MSLHIQAPGLQTTLQSAPRIGYRHLGLPSAGPADPLSMALANRLVSNAYDAPALEITFGGAALTFSKPAGFAITGADADLTLDGAPVPLHTTLSASANQRLEISMATTGARLYLAVQGGFDAETVLGSSSTYLPARLGGHEGRSLASGDILPFPDSTALPDPLATPDTLRQTLTNSFALRLCPSAEFGQLAPTSAQTLFSETFTAAPQIDRMGITLKGHQLSIASDGNMPSAPVFPGTIQCPENGEPIILLSDAGTTGGYPRIATIARCDQHLLGQIRPNSHIRFIHRSHTQAASDYTAKSALLHTWLPGFVL